MKTLARVNGTEVYITAIIHSVLFVPAMLPKGGLKALGLGEVFIGVLSQHITYKAGGKQFLIHKAVKQNVCRAFIRAIEGGGIVIHTDGGIVYPEIQSRRLVTGVTYIPINKQKQFSEIGAKPFGVSAVALNNKSNVLCQTGLVNVGLLMAFQHVGRHMTGENNDGSAAVLLNVVEEVHNTALLVGVYIGILCELSKGDVHQPAVPIPKTVRVHTARNYMLIFKISLRLAEHLFIIFLCIFKNYPAHILSIP
jgi:hypothetical protein